jgi:hypothetical protein
VHTIVSSFPSFPLREKELTIPTDASLDCPGSLGRQSPRNRCTASQKNFREARKIFQRPSPLDTWDSSFEPPQDFLKFAFHLTKGSKKGNRANIVFCREKYGIFCRRGRFPRGVVLFPEE